MTISLSEIYAGLKAWRDERGITAQSQKEGYIINVMEELGELAQALRDYERFQNELKTCDNKEYLLTAWHYNNEKAEHEIIDALCDIAVFTINAGADIPCDKQIKVIEIKLQKTDNLAVLVNNCGGFAKSFVKDDFTDGHHLWWYDSILINCAALCEKYGYNFEVAMLETIKEISSRTGFYDKASKKWVKDTSDEAKAKWHKADYEKARI